MRIFVSSSFEDLREHRAAAIRVLRQLGHEVLAMEDMIAGSSAPLPKVLEMVDRSEAYVGVFAWRYGYVPARAAGQQPAMISIPLVEGAIDGETSITHWLLDHRRQKLLAPPPIDLIAGHPRLAQASVNVSLAFPLSTRVF